MQVKKQQLVPDIEQQTGSKSGKEYVWFQIRKGLCQGSILSTCLFNFLCRVHQVKCWAGESQDGIKIARRNINNLRYADDTTLKAKSEEELKTS